MNESAGYDELLSHPVAVALHQLVAPILEIEQRQQFSAAPVDVFSVLTV
jgi:hypothetical protein